MNKTSCHSTSFLLWQVLFLASVLSLTLLPQGLYGQSSRKANEKQNPTQEEAARRRRPASTRSDERVKRKHQPDSKTTALERFKKLEEEAKERQKQQAKAFAKSIRKQRKKRNRDPSYFGHKRKPKIRPLAKRRLCKECGIVH